MNTDPKKIEKRMRKLIIIFIVIAVSACSLYSQNITIKGRVVSNRFDTLNDVFITINDTIEVGKTDLNGFFQIDIPVSLKKILFRGVGVEPAIIELVDKCDEVEVIMLLSGSDDFMTLKKSDRLRKKRLRKLPALHKEAFTKGIFKTDCACYTQTFIPYYKKKRK